MNNRKIAAQLKYFAQLLELHNENPFKAKSYNIAAFHIDKLGKELSLYKENELLQIEGIGKSVAGKIIELQKSGTIKEMDTLLSDTPIGILEMLKIKGIGPKKIHTIWKELGIQSPGELLYACDENRLVELKGFGIKTQYQIKKSVEFILSSVGKFHYATVEQTALELLQCIQNIQGVKQASLTGVIRRKCEIIDKIEIVATTESHYAIEKGALYNDSILNKEKTEIYEDIIISETRNGIPVMIMICAVPDFYSELFKTTGNEAHLKKTKELGLSTTGTYSSEEEIYAQISLPYIEPELREGTCEIVWAKENRIPKLLEVMELKGILHTHTTYSDGLHTLEEMAVYCKELGYEYLGISDHSHSAFYANGLQPEKIIDQHHKIDELNKKLTPFKIFKGIESDILSNGSLDYEEAILATFDFIIASVHSNLTMSEEKATERLIKAIENPYTTILGHPTGRLLLAREGYPINHKKIIDACASHGVIIEMNAHPYRLDIDWRWIQYVVERGVKISINPDAHRKEGYYDMYYGVCVARKGGLTKEMTFNTLSKAEIETYFIKRKQNLLTKVTYKPRNF